MKLSVEPFNFQHEVSIAAFNARMRAGNAPTAFLLPERSASPGDNPMHEVSATQYVAVDADSNVRGGVLCWEHPVVAGAEVQKVINLQAPLSEGIVDPQYVFVAPQLIKSVLRRTPYVYVVGMGSESNPLPRVLKVMGWTVRTVPFFFRLLRVGRCFQDLSLFRSSPFKRMVGRIAAGTGAASFAAAVLHRATGGAQKLYRAYTAERITEWGDWADTIWNSFSQNISFGVVRNRRVLPFFYPLAGMGPIAWRLVRDGVAEGWFGLIVSRMNNNAYFGNLNVATLTDCVGSAEAIQSGAMHAVEQAKALGADLLITNQQHQLLRDACTAAGFRSGPSNYLVGMSKKLAEAVNEPTVYVTRRDGDGLVNLGGR